MQFDEFQLIGQLFYPEIAVLAIDPLSKDS